MKIVMMLISFLAIQTWAQESTQSMMPPPAVNSSELDIVDAQPSLASKEVPKWRFQIGESSFKTNTGENGNGLTLSAGYDFNSLIGVGLSYTDFKNDVGFAGGAENMLFTSAYLQLTPIRYRIQSFDLAGSVLLGVDQSNYEGNQVAGEMFYGAAFALNFNKQIGLGFDTKISRNIQSMNEISLIGYF